MHHTFGHYGYFFKKWDTLKFFGACMGFVLFFTMEAQGEVDLVQCWFVMARPLRNKYFRPFLVSLLRVVRFVWLVG